MIMAIDILKYHNDVIIGNIRWYNDARMAIVWAWHCSFLYTDFDLKETEQTQTQQPDHFGETRSSSEKA